ncbi:MAG TPA: serine/threonine-protein kinase [Kofleriaceae bacterium]|nr:serine/threonine-protein kinase [Kofleriaceae bacterium]
MSDAAPFGKYFLGDKIATGGMAEIYLAKLLGPGGFEKQLVIKQISPALSNERQFVELFVAEAKTLVSLSHGNIVPVYELGQVGDTYFIAMEFVDGPTLAGLEIALEARGQRMAPAMAAYVVAELCKGLDYAHRKGDGLIHRDLSPRNVMVSREGEVKLVDFGLAVAAASAPTTRRADRPAGSFPYMSPEQVRQEALDPRSDIFSAGVILWELLTGLDLFARDTDDGTLAAVLEAEIAPPSLVRDGVPDELERIAMRALERDSARRWESAGAMGTALSRYAYSVSVLSTPADLARLVARVCPPEARKAAQAEDEDGGVKTAPREEDALRTKPMARRMVKTFAASEAFEGVLKNATPAIPFPAIVGPVPGDREGDRDRDRDRARARARGRARVWIGLAVVAAVLAAGALMWRRGHRETTAVVAIDAGAVVVAPIAIDAGVIDAAAPPPDAGRTAPPRRDAGARKPPPPKGRATLEVGANPWADVYVDGAKVGQAPGSWSITAGAHVVEVRHRDQTRRFSIDVAADGTKNLGLVDFTQ